MLVSCQVSCERAQHPSLSTGEQAHSELSASKVRKGHGVMCNAQEQNYRGYTVNRVNVEKMLSKYAIPKIKVLAGSIVLQKNEALAHCSVIVRACLDRNFQPDGLTGWGYSLVRSPS